MIARTEVRPIAGGEIFLPPYGIVLSRLEALELADNLIAALKAGEPLTLPAEQAHAEPVVRQSGSRIAGPHTPEQIGRG